eukprot:48686-Eustigmatos_ZCMA.PRE.1
MPVTRHGSKRNSTARCSKGHPGLLHEARAIPNCGRQMYGVACKEGGASTYVLEVRGAGSY